MVKRLWLAVLCAVMVACPILSGCSTAEKKIIIGSKDYTDSMICGEIMAQLLERNLGFTVERKLNLGATNIVFEAMKNGDIQLYPEFTSTALFSLFNMDRIDDLDECYQTVKDKFHNEHQMDLLPSYGYMNNYGTAVSKELADEHNLTKTSQLEPLAPTLVYGGDHDFFDRPDGFTGFKDTYNLNFREERKVQIALKYQAAGQGDIDVVEVYTTDPQIIQENLVVLEDDKTYFPLYPCCPLLREDVSAQYPELKPELEKLINILDDATMRQLNGKVDIEGVPLAEVATEFLRSKSLID